MSSDTDWSTKASGLLAECIQALRPRERLWPDEWADRYRTVTMTAFPGRWSTDLVPYLRGPMRAYADPSVYRIVMMCGSQVGKTELNANLLLYATLHLGLDSLFGWPTEEDCRRHNRFRLRPAFIAAARETGAVFTERTDAGAFELSASGHTVFMGWAQTPTKLKGLPLPNVFKDEIDEWPEGHSELADERAKAGIDPKIVETSTPTRTGIGIDRAYKATDRRSYWVPCPHADCAQYFVIRWEHVRWGVVDEDGTERTGSACTEEEVERTAHLRCPACDAKIHDHHKPQMLRLGVWCRDGERPERRSDAATRPATHLNVPLPEGVVIVGEPVSPGREAGFHLSSLYSPFPACTIGIVARKFAKAGFRMTPKFVAGELGEAWEDRGEKIEEGFLAARCVPVSAGGYALGTVPAWAVCLLGVIDVQQDCCYATVRAYSPRGEFSGLVSFERIAAPVTGRLVELDALLARVLVRVSDGAHLRVAMWGIDTGHRRDEVMKWAERHQRGIGKVRPVKGVPGDVRPVPYWMAGKLVNGQVDHSQTSKGNPLSVPLLIVNTHWWKDELLARQQDEHAWRLPEGTPPAYLEQVTSEQRVVRTVSVSLGRGSRYAKGTRMEWVKRPGRTDNHAWDTEVYLAALADYAVVREIQATIGAVRPETVRPADTTPRATPARPNAGPPQGTRFRRLGPPIR